MPGMRPCIDETGYSKPVDMILNNDLADLPALKKMLWPYGLDLRPTVQKNNHDGNKRQLTIKSLRGSRGLQGTEVFEKISCS